MYCMDCGRELPVGASFCAYCGKRVPVRAAPEPESGRQKKLRLRTELAGRRQGMGQASSRQQGERMARVDVPRWVGWAGFGLFILGLASLLLPWLVFCLWCYRRGRREGASLAVDFEPPLSYFPARLAGWLLASMFLPIVDWFTAVHVPTMCYQQGIRVGACRSPASITFTQVPGLVVAVVSAVLGFWLILAGIGYAVSGNWQRNGGQQVVVPTLQERVLSQEWQTFVLGCRPNAWTEPYPTPVGSALSVSAHEVGAQPGSYWMFCVLNPDYIFPAEAPLRFTILAEAPNGQLSLALQYVELGRYLCGEYPTDFGMAVPGGTPTSGVPGRYVAQFSIEEMVVAHASCTVVEP